MSFLKNIKRLSCPSSTGLAKENTPKNWDKLLPTDKKNFICSCEKLLRNEFTLLAGIAGTKYSLYHSSPNQWKYRIFITKIICRANKVIQG